MKTLLILDNETKLAMFRKYLGDKYEYISTNGLLYDLPPNQLGIDILKNFYMQESIREHNSETIRKLRQYQANPFYVITSPNEEGIRLYAQILKLFRLGPEICAHITLPYLNSETIKKFESHAKNLNTNIYEGALTRRCLERLGGFLLTEFFSFFESKYTYPIKPHLSLSAAHILSYIYQHVVSVHDSNNGFQLHLESSPSNFKAHEVLYNSQSSLDTLLPKYYNSDRESREVFEFIKEYSNELKMIKQDDITTDWIPPSRINFESLISYLLSRFNFSQYFLYKVLYHLYNSGYITYFQRSNTKIPTNLLEIIRKHFQDNNWINNLDTKKLGLLSKNVSHCILPITFEPYTYSDNILVKQVFQAIKEYFCMYFSKKQEKIETYYLFQLKKHYFLGNSFKLNSTLPFLSGILQPPTPSDKDKFSINLYPMECLEEGVKIEEIFNFFDHSTISLNLYAAIDQLLHQYKYLEFNDNALYLTESGFVCCELLKVYSPFFKMDHLKLDEKAIYSIMSGNLSKDFYLNAWYHSFRKHHEKVMNEIHEEH